jgi:hypothetical protein
MLGWGGAWFSSTVGRQAGWGLLEKLKCVGSELERGG